MSTSKINFKNEKKIVREIIANATGINKNKIKDKTDLFKEFGIDSLKIIEIISTVYEKLGVQVSEERIKKLTSLELIVREIGRSREKYKK